MSEPISGYQSWQKLLFLHWRVPAEQIQARLPGGLTAELFDGSAWLGVVPFSMEKVRPWWSPSVPGISWFLETNLRTYVRHDNGQTGVWFFSLDANHRLAVEVARRFWYLNYRYASLQLDESRSEGAKISYQGFLSGNEYDIKVQPPEPISLQTATAGSLDEFLLERYRLFARRPDGSFYTGLVHHTPYRYAPPQIEALTQSLTDQVATDIKVRKPDHIAWSPGVDVAVSPLRRI